MGLGLLDKLLPRSEYAGWDEEVQKESIETYLERWDADASVATGADSYHVSVEMTVLGEDLKYSARYHELGEFVSDDFVGGIVRDLAGMDVGGGECEWCSESVAFSHYCHLTAYLDDEKVVDDIVCTDCVSDASSSEVENFDSHDGRRCSSCKGDLPGTADEPGDQFVISAYNLDIRQMRACLCPECGWEHDLMRSERG